jgi:hypothetical protein
MVHACNTWQLEFNSWQGQRFLSWTQCLDQFWFDPSSYSLVPGSSLSRDKVGGACN